MRKLFILIAALCISVFANGQRLVILHTNDSHSQIEPIRTGRNAGRGGVDRRLQFIDSVRAEYGAKKVLLLDAGDYNQGTPYFNVGKGDIELALMNAMAYDVATVGNHEFDNGQQELARRLTNATYPTLCCNYDFTGTPLESIIKPYTIIKRGGLKIGIVGATSYLEGNVLTQNLTGMKRLDTISEVNKWADWLKNKKNCDIVIFLSHLGYDGGSEERPSDVLVAKESENIDFIIGGHSHTFITKPKVVKNKLDKDVPIVQAGCQGIEIGELKIY
ncbi:MAG: metallophosphoesterase [Bacteroidales bacterium]|nr:metallophosphoesterase [Bacteroidales bacterium]